jgi:hypothetical protein
MSLRIKLSTTCYTLYYSGPISPRIFSTLGQLQKNMPMSRGNLFPGKSGQWRRRDAKCNWGPFPPLPCSLFQSRLGRKGGWDTRTSSALRRKSQRTSQTTARGDQSQKKLGIRVLFYRDQGGAGDTAASGAPTLLGVAEAFRNWVLLRKLKSTKNKWPLFHCSEPFNSKIIPR